MNLSKKQKLIICIIVSLCAEAMFYLTNNNIFSVGMLVDMVFPMEWDTASAFPPYAHIDLYSLMMFRVFSIGALGGFVWVFLKVKINRLSI